MSKKNKQKNNNNNNNKPMSNNDKEKQQLYAKLGITEDVIKNDDVFISEAKEKSKENSIEQKEKIVTDDEIGWKNPIELLKNVFYGIFMAISDAIPGYSGGTTLSIIGFYDKLIYRAKNIFKPEVKGTWWKYLIWILPFAIVWVGLLVGIMLGVNEISKENQGIILVFLFGTFAFFSIPLFFITNKEKLPSYVTKFSTFKDPNNKKKNIISLCCILLGFLFLFVVAIIIRFAFGGVTFIKDPNEYFDYKNFDMGNVFLFLGSGFLAGFCMLIPGISGSLMLYLTNSYSKVSMFISDIPGRFKDNIQVVEPGASIPYIVLLLIGVVLGLISSILFVNWVKNKFESYFYNISFGFVIASFLTIFVSLSANDYATLSNTVTLAVSLSMIPVAILVNVAIFFALNQTKKINYLKFYIKTKKDKVVN